MRAPLGVWIYDGDSGYDVTEHVKALRFQKTAPGGHHSASMQIRLSLETFKDLGPADRIDITDGMTGRVLWSGHTDNPGASDGAGGQSFDLDAMGSTALASDHSAPYLYVTRDLQGWYQWKRDGGASNTVAQASVSDDPANVADGEGLLVQFPRGQVLATNDLAMMRFDMPAGQFIGGVAGIVKSGKADANYRGELMWWDGVPGSSGATAFGSGSGIFTGDNAQTKYETTDIAAAMNIVIMRIRRSGGATTVADDLTWTWFRDVSVLGQRVDKNGTLISGSANLAPASSVLAHQVVADVLGRMLTNCDPITAEIATTAELIDQLAYLDGATPAQVFDDLTLHEPDFYWGIGERMSSGLFRFWYRAWPTDARYEISQKDAYRKTGSDVELCNRIAVYWTDAAGSKKTTIRGAYVPALGDKNPVLADGTIDPTFTGRIKDADAITLPDGRGSEANAERIGDQILAVKASPPKAATAVVGDRRMDLLTGREVAPWEWEPGYMVRVRETGDLLRLTEVEYIDDDCAVSLTLGEPVLSVEQWVARLTKALIGKAA